MLLGMGGLDPHQGEATVQRPAGYASAVGEKPVLTPAEDEADASQPPTQAEDKQRFIEWTTSRGSLRAALIRGNPCRFSDRYRIEVNSCLGEGGFGKVFSCIDTLVGMRRAVKRLGIPQDDMRKQALHCEVNAMVSLDHPHIVQLIEYFVEGDELLLVMELLEGPTLSAKIKEQRKLREEVAARCVRHMLKALYCCHCQGIVHNDVTADNFQFRTPQPDASLKMIDFGMSERFSSGVAGYVPPSPTTSANLKDFAISRTASDLERSRFAQERDVWDVGTIFFSMLSGRELFPQTASGQPMYTLELATDPNYVPSEVRSLRASEQATTFLEGMLQPTSSKRLTCREALLSPFITRLYVKEESSVPSHNGVKRIGRKGGTYTLERYMDALRGYLNASRLKRLSLLVAAHLLTSNIDLVSDIQWLFRRLVLNGFRLDAKCLRKGLSEAGMDVPEDFSALLSGADMHGKGGLEYIEFVATAIITEPALYCNDAILTAMFLFFDYDNSGTVDDASVGTVIQSDICVEGAVQEACGKDCMDFADFRTLMVPAGWKPQSGPAPWSNAPDAFVDPRSGNVVQPATSTGRKNPIKSDPSEDFAVCQKSGFHLSALRPFYAAQPVSNVVLGLVRGTSPYAREAVAMGLAEILDVGGDDKGAFFIMPNPKYHWSAKDVETAKVPVPHLRFCAWWIHPAFLDELRSWYEGCAAGPSSPVAAPVEPFAKAELGKPGDFGFSDIKKPPGYLHTYRDLEGLGHADMLDALVKAVGPFAALDGRDV
eukprot:TRINITY_DN5885_c0_g1_i3.p1 TRINITY_DN5885_c0_g1~~TRINITY_DN5885_c0_g1_i3.p1  ORF type:complete len:770 (-),score=152.91 TRINITY_DN5885_c0_g1_i3:65-2374(-)